MLMVIPKITYIKNISFTAVVVSGLIFSVSFRLPVAMLWSERFTIAESFYSVNYRLSIITSKVRQIIPVMKT